MLPTNQSSSFSIIFFSATESAAALRLLRNLADGYLRWIKRERERERNALASHLFARRLLQFQCWLWSRGGLMLQRRGPEGQVTVNRKATAIITRLDVPFVTHTPSSAARRRGLLGRAVHLPFLVLVGPIALLVARLRLLLPFRWSLRQRQSRLWRRLWRHRRRWRLRKNERTPKSRPPFTRFTAWLRTS